MLWNENDIASVRDRIASDLQPCDSVFQRQLTTTENRVRSIA